ncbi:1-phosphatidylinositol 4,5-bisphosphate phosphodiesterase zeta-1 [Aquarana catesbeiana]|uniref:1-phosphatidylinositol 4,5-bisphosphate phosphodiesterase zeta-1 n=1 Tax=Aquarana catesbeiana TaxID=8400 RepID=UPI003CCA13FE
MASLTEPPFGNERWCINWNPLGSFLETTPNGDTTKFSKGGSKKGPPMRPNATSLASFSETTSECTLADLRLSAIGGICLSSLNLLCTHLEDVFQSMAPEGKMTYSKMMEAFQELAIPVDSIHALVLFKEQVKHRRGHININIFKSIYKTFIYRTELVDIFEKYSTSAKLLLSKELLEFLQTELCESCASTQRVSELVHKYEKNHEAQSKKCMTFDGFARFMNSEQTHIFRRDCTKIYQDMNQPLTNYFISTSHNTYLLSDQLVGESHLWAYGNALMHGLRCLEIDCFDGAKGEPIVYHGRTLTSKVYFKSVIYVIDKYAFKTSQYPLVLSLEDHCSYKQQEVLANHLITILGDKLLRTAITDSSSEVLPSPEALKGKILLKHKKIEPVQIPSPALSGQAVGEQDEEESTDGLEESEDEKQTGKHVRFKALKGKILKKQKKIEPAQIPSPVLSRQAAGEQDEEESTDGLEESEDEKPTGKHVRFKLDKVKKHLRSKLQGKCKEIVPKLSDLVIYIKPKEFVSFQHSQSYQKFHETNSLSEREAKQLVRHSAQDFVYHNKNFLTRIYPKGSRIDSSNLQPQEFWNVGCQMVALNIQSPGVPMDLQDGRFQDNGGCGYVLKPDFLRDSDCTFDPNNLLTRRPFSLQIKVISGFLLPPSKLSKANTANPVVTLEIYGVPPDQCSKKTRVAKNNAFNPQWNKSFTFSINVPELAMIRFCVEDRIPVVGNEFVGQYTLPLTCISKGNTQLIHIILIIPVHAAGLFHIQP